MVEGAASDVGDRFAQLAREILRRFADEIGTGDLRVERLQPREPAVLSAAADDLIDLVEAGERRTGGIRVGRLVVVD